MSSTDPNLDPTQMLAENMLERSIWLNARCDALELALGALARLGGHDPARLLDTIAKAQNQSYSERLQKIELTDPALAGRIDRRTSHGEVISDDYRMIQFDDSDSDEKK